jgi:hypothetical protein
MSVTAFTNNVVVSTIDVPVIPKTVKITVKKMDPFVQGLPEYYLTVSDTMLPVPDPALHKITWILDVSGVAAGIKAKFFNPAIIFADPTAPFLRDPQGATDTSRSGYWSNLELRNRRSFPYSIYVDVNGSTYVHDPTVENQPPLNG